MVDLKTERDIFPLTVPSGDCGGRESRSIDGRIDSPTTGEAIEIKIIIGSTFYKSLNIEGTGICIIFFHRVSKISICKTCI